MAVYTYSGNGTDGTTITTTGAPSGSWNWTYRTLDASCTLEFDSAQAAHGTASMLVNTVTGSRAFGVFNFTGSDQVMFRGYFRWSALSSTNQTFVSINNGSSVRIAALTLDTSNRVCVQDNTSNVTTGSAVSLNTWYRMELKVDRTNTVLTGWVYEGESAVPAQTISFTTPSLGSVNIAQLVVGKYNTSNQMGPMWADSLEVRTGTTTLIGPEASSSPLSCTAVTASGWSATGGTAIAVLSDTSDTTYITSGDNPSSSTVDLTLPPLSTPAGDLRVLLRGYKTGASSGTVVGTLRNGGSTVSTAATQQIPDSLTGSGGNLWLVFPAADISGIGSSTWSAGTLVVRATITAAA